MNIIHKPLWVQYGKTWREFKNDNLNQPGTIINVNDEQKQMIGNLNELGGVCDDCLGISSNDRITEYIVLAEGIQ